MVIVGAGEAGARAASGLREQGYTGAVTLIGDEPHTPYERPPLSKAIMTGDGHAAPPFILDEAKLSAHGITHLGNSRAERIDRDKREVLLVDGRRIGYAKLLVATGAGPRRLPTPGADGTVLYLRTFADALGLRDRLKPGSKLVVIGGGFIGLEIAASAIGRGCSVALLEMAPRILTRGVPPQIAERVTARHRAAGVELLTGVGIERIERRGESAVVHLADGRDLAADAVIAGIGAVPETGLAEASGLPVENGIKVDALLRTADPDIFAAGDCCSFPHPLYGGRRIRLEAWRNAQDQANLAARNMLGGTDEYAAVPWFWSDQYDETLQIAGLTDEGRTIVERDLGVGRLFFHLDDDGRLVAISGVGPNSAIARDVRLGEMLIAKRATPDPAKLASPAVKLKALLAG